MVVCVRGCVGGVGGGVGGGRGWQAKASLLAATFAEQSRPAWAGVPQRLNESRLETLLLWQARAGPPATAGACPTWGSSPSPYRG